MVTAFSSSLRHLPTAITRYSARVPRSLASVSPNGSASHVCSVATASTRHFSDIFASRAVHSGVLSEKGNISSLLDKQVIQLQPGLLLIKGGLSPEQQIELSKIAFEAGKTGFWKTDEMGRRALNANPYRGQVNDALHYFPSIVADLCQRNVHLAAKNDTTIKTDKATHLNLLYYKTIPEIPEQGFIPWHQDTEETDGEGGLPIVSFNIGDSCDFLINNVKPKIDASHPRSNPLNLAHRVRLESGDVLIFGGPSRHIWHSVYKIHENTAPSFLDFKDARLNYTLRYTPKVLGREAELAAKPCAYCEGHHQSLAYTRSLERWPSATD